MAVRSTKGILKASEPRDSADERGGDEVEEQRPRNLPPNTFPTEGFSIEVDGKIKSQYPTAEAAQKVGAELKRRFPVLKVMIYDAAVKTRTLVEAAE
jgi:hypothetical protein